MFGSPDWFKPKSTGSGLSPICWQGWAYTLAWTAVMGLPFVLLLFRGQPVESVAWLAVTGGALVYDVRDIARKMHQAKFSETVAAAPQHDVFYIGDSESGNAPVATRNYSFKRK